MTTKEKTSFNQPHIWLLVLLAALILLLGPRLLGAAEEEEESFLRVFDAVIRVELPEEAARNGRMVVEVEAVCSEDDSCSYDFEIEQLVGHVRTVASGELEMGDDGILRAEADWLLEDDDCGETWEGIVKVRAVDDDDDDPVYLTAERTLAIHVPGAACGRRSSS